MQIYSETKTVLLKVIITSPRVILLNSSFSYIIYLKLKLLITTL